MGKFTKFLCLSLLLPTWLAANSPIGFAGDYFIYNETLDYIYGGGNIVITGPEFLIKGQTLYLDTARMQGVLYGGIQLERAGKIETGHILFFTTFPPRFLLENFKGKILQAGDDTLPKILKKPAPNKLKEGDLYFEFRSFKLDKYGKIKAKTIIPYVMGLPTMPLKSFIIRRGLTPEKTMVSFKNLNVFGLEGLAATFMLRLREKFVRGDFDIKLYERELLGLDGTKRGVLFTGSSEFLVNKKKILGISTLFNSGEGSFNLNLSHGKQYKSWSYALGQTISGRKNTPVFTNFSANLTLKSLKWITPSLAVTHDLKRSYSYGLSTPVKIWNRLKWNINWQRRIINNSYYSDTSDLSTSMQFTSSLLTVSTNYNLSNNLLDAAIRQNFSVNMRLLPLTFLDRNLTFHISSFYMFSSIPSGENTLTRSIPGINLAVNSQGALMPLGFKLVPSIMINHLWDDKDENFTDFNYQLALEKRIGHFAFSLAYALSSRYKADNFWVEGNNRQNVSAQFLLLNPGKYNFNLRLYCNNELALENMTFTSRINLIRGFSLSSFILYYNELSRFQTLEIFVEKQFLNSGKIQGGYSLALKKFFIRFVTI